ncbi:MAG: hypothetical protein EZS28_028536, partial [Streblomastix strix]
SSSGGAISVEVYSEQQLELNEITITNCSGPIGGGIYCLVNDKGKLIIFSTQFKNCTCIDGQGGGLFVRLNGINSQCLLSETVMENCTSSIGGGIHARLNNGELKLNGVNMTNCTSTQGGGLYLFIQSANCLCIISETLIKECNSTDGGGIFAQIAEGNLELSKLTIQDCQSQNGGGIYINLDGNGKIQFGQEILIQNCASSQDNGQGGGLFIDSLASGGIFTISGSIIIENCTNQFKQGGGIYASASYYIQFEFKQMTIRNCTSILEGGGMQLQLSGDSETLIRGQCLFDNCTSIDQSGGGMHIIIEDNSKLEISESVVFQNCTASIGGGIFAQLHGGNISIKQTTMKQCSALNGGGIYVQIFFFEQFLIDNEVLIQECVAFETGDVNGRGGGIYLKLEEEIQSQFQIGSGTQFTLNNASQFGRDIFVYCKNLEYLQFDIIQQLAANSVQCGKIQLPCLTLNYGRTKVLTPEWTEYSIPTNIEVKDKQIGIGGAVAFIGQNLHINLTFVRFVEQCESTKSGISSSIQVLESGGAIIHSEKSQTRCNLHSSIFLDCSSSSSSSLTSNVDPSDITTFIPLWLREKQIGQDGSGLIIAYGETQPSIKADGIQFIEGSILSLIGEGENSSSIIQKDSSHNLFILKDSQLNTSQLTTEIWGQETALIQIDGNQMSKLNGLRVNGGKLEGQLAYGPVIEVIKG